MGITMRWFLIISLAIASTKPEVLAVDEPLSGGKPLSHWIKKLGDQDTTQAKARIAAFSEIGLLAVPSLQNSLRNSDPVVREAAAQALGAIGNKAKAAVPDLCKALKDPDRYVRRNATLALGAIGSSAHDAIGPLIGAMTQVDLQPHIPGAIAEIGLTAVPELTKALTNPNRLIREGAAIALRDLASDDSTNTTRPVELNAAIVPLCRALKDPDEPVRRAAARALDPLKADESAGDLIVALDDGDRYVVELARDALRHIGLPAVPLLLKRVRDSRNPNREARQESAHILAYIAASHRQDPDLINRSDVPELIKMLSDRDRKVARDISTFLARLDDRIVTDLIRAMRDSNPLIRMGAIASVSSRSHNDAVERAVDPLVEALGDTEESVQLLAAEALEVIGSRGRSSAPALLKTLDRGNESLRLASATALGSVCSPWVRHGSEKVMENDFNCPSGAVQGLIKHLEDPSAEVRAAAANSIGIIGPSAKAAVPGLIAKLQDTNPSVQIAAAASLGSMGIWARPAIIPLAKLHENESARIATESALKQIGEALQSGMDDLSSSELEAAVADLADAERALKTTRTGVDSLETVRRAHQALKAKLNSESATWSFLLKWGILPLVGIFILYALGLPFLISHYEYAWARTFIKSGLLDRFPWFHEVILNTGWARSRLFENHADSMRQLELPVTGTYIPQSIYLATDEASSLADLAASPELLFSVAAQRVLILGRSGSGKSVLLRAIAQTVGRQFLDGSGDMLPILLDLKQSSLAEKRFEDLIRNQLTGGGVELPDKILDDLIQKGGFLLLIDSLNEVEGKPIIDHLRQYLERNLKNRIVLASQHDVLERRDFQLYRLAELSEDQARNYLMGAVGRDIWAQIPQSTRDLALNPSSLELLAQSVTDQAVPGLPTSRAELFRALLVRDNVLKDWVTSDSPKIRALFSLSYRMVDEGLTAIPADDLGQLVRRELDIGTQKSTDADVKTLTDSMRRSRLFKDVAAPSRSKSGFVTFQHELVGKYLAARHLTRAFVASDPEKVKQISKLAVQAKWSDIMQFFVDEVESPADLTIVLKNFQDGRRNAADKAMLVKLVAYAIETKPATSIDQAVRDRCEQDLRKVILQSPN
jgi:HEAT repeat protein/energy-coupling factor transporter ATP-binding protein EcfA2